MYFKGRGKTHRGVNIIFLKENLKTLQAKFFGTENTSVDKKQWWHYTVERAVAYSITYYIVYNIITMYSGYMKKR